MAIAVSKLAVSSEFEKTIRGQLGARSEDLVLQVSENRFVWEFSTTHHPFPPFPTNYYFWEGRWVMWRCLGRALYHRYGENGIAAFSASIWAIAIGCSIGDYPRTGLTQRQWSGETTLTPKGETCPSGDVFEGAFAPEESDISFGAIEKDRTNLTIVGLNRFYEGAFLDPALVEMSVLWCSQDGHYRDPRVTVTRRLRKKTHFPGPSRAPTGTWPRGGREGQSAFRHSIWGIVIHKEFEILREGGLETWIPEKRPEQVIKIAAGGSSSAGGREGGGAVQAKLG
ncbi:hypothetical protein BJV77DRAFT_1151242 [Russula vinacea]|nr:hypothetical protein BJV77DRAFT_1151242 [Russula vinacea]